MALGRQRHGQRELLPNVLSEVSTQRSRQVQRNEEQQAYGHTVMSFDPFLKIWYESGAIGGHLNLMYINLLQ
jgi:hypothetical protein